MNCCRRHGAKCPYASFNPCNLIPPCKLRKCTQPCSPQCPYCKLNHRLYCYYLEGYRHMLKNKNKQLCMMEYFVRQMNCLKNAIQHQLQQCEKLQCSPECEIKYCRPDCKPKCSDCRPKYYDCKPECYNCKPKCFDFKSNCYEIDCDTTPCFTDKCSSKASTYAELLDRINYITQKLSCLETKNFCVEPPRKCSTRYSTDSDECYIPVPKCEPQCRKYRFVQCEPPPRCETPPMCYPSRCHMSPPPQCYPSTSCGKPKPQCYASQCYTMPPKCYTPPCYVSCESTCSQQPACFCPPKKKSSLVFEISYETHEKKKKPQVQEHARTHRLSSPSTLEHTSSAPAHKVQRERIVNSNDGDHDQEDYIPFINLPSIL